MTVEAEVEAEAGGEKACRKNSKMDDDAPAADAYAAQLIQQGASDFGHNSERGTVPEIVAAAAVIAAREKNVAEAAA